MPEPLKILYVTLTCDAYVPTRCKWQTDTWIPHVAEHVFLGARSDPSRNMVGWDTGDTYETCPRKFIEFMRHMPLNGYDWVVIVDDDTFVVPRRLEAYLQTLDATRPLYVGATCTDGWDYMSGGAGFALSATLVSRLRSYVQETSTQDLHVALWGDKTFGAWVHAVGGLFEADTRFHGDYSLSYAPDCFTCHYVKEEGFYALAARVL